MRKVIKFNDLEQLDSALLARRAYDAADRVGFKIITERAGFTIVASFKGRTCSDPDFEKRISATFRPDLVPEHIRERMAADRANYAKNALNFATQISKTPEPSRPRFKVPAELPKLAREIRDNARKKRPEDFEVVDPFTFGPTKKNTNEVDNYVYGRLWSL